MIFISLPTRYPGTGRYLCVMENTLAALLQNLDKMIVVATTQIHTSLASVDTKLSELGTRVPVGNVA